MLCSPCLSWIHSFRFLCTKSISQRRWTDQPFLPYLNNEDYLKTLEKHVTSQPQSKILLVWGARSVSKSRGLQIKIAEWRERGHEVIDVDLKGVPVSYLHFLERFRSAVKTSNLSIAKQDITAITKIERNKRVQASLRKYALPLSALAKALLTGNIKLMGLTWEFGELGKSIYDWSQGDASPSQPEDFVALFELLEKHAKSCTKPPIVVWREIQNLSELRDGPSEDWPQLLYKHIFTHFEPRKQGTSVVPVIFESSDLLWARAQSVGVSRESFVPCFLGHLTEEASRKWLVEETLPGFPDPIFTEEEFGVIWRYTGGHQGTIYVLHGMLREGRTLENALVELQRQDYARFAGAMNLEDPNEDYDKIILERENLILELHKSNYKLFRKNLKDPSVLHFVTSNMLFTDGELLTPQNMPIQLAIQKYLKNTKLISDDFASE